MKMKILAAVAAVSFATPAFAEGAFVEAHTGWDEISALGASKDGIVYGGGVGYDVSLGGASFAGVEATFDGSSTKACESDIFVFGDKACVKASRDIAIVGRLGAHLGKATDFLVFGGYTNARLTASYDDGVTKISNGANGDGVRVGAGLNQHFGTDVFGKVEYRYSNYESDFSRHQVLVGVGYQF